jgi:hypothetical protein
MTCEGSPIGMADCACRIPSKIHRMPNPILSSRRPVGSGSLASRAPAAEPLEREVPGNYPCLVAMSLASQSARKIIATMTSCCRNADRNASAISTLLTPIPDCIPGMAVPDCCPDGLDKRDHTVAGRTGGVNGFPCGLPTLYRRAYPWRGLPDL